MTRLAPFEILRLIVAHKEHVLFVPSQTVIGRGVERDVYRVESGTAHKVPVQTGISNWDRTEITSGLSEGDSVVASLDSAGLSDGAHVAVGADAGT